eukprot:361532-Chlamydomonas_euryale.AAC.2
MAARGQPQLWVELRCVWERRAAPMWEDGGFGPGKLKLRVPPRLLLPTSSLWPTSNTRPHKCGTSSLLA